MKTTIMIMLVSALSGCVNDTGSSTASLTGDELDALIAADSPLLTMDEAIEIAQMEAPGATLVAIELSVEDDEDEPVAWDATFYLDGNLTDVDVHGIDGSIVETEDEGPALRDPSTYLSVSEARELGLAEQPGFVLAVEAEVEEDDEHPHYDVVIYSQSTGEFVEVELHAETGEVTEVEIEAEYED